MSTFRAAIAQYPVSRPVSWDEAESTLAHWIDEAAAAGASLLVFPEYAAMSLAALFVPQVLNS